MHILVDTGGAVTRRGELLGLAVAIEQAPSDNEVWRLWNTAVGIFPARHLLIVAESGEDQATSWADAPRAPVTARFREQGVRAAVGRRARTADYAKGRAAARQARAASAAERAEAEARLRQRSGSRVGTWGSVTEAELDFFLELVGVTRYADGATTSRAGITADGRWRVVLAEPEKRTDVASLQSARGRMVTVDWQFHLERATSLRPTTKMPATRAFR